MAKTMGVVSFFSWFLVIFVCNFFLPFYLENMRHCQVLGCQNKMEGVRKPLHLVLLLLGVFSTELQLLTKNWRLQN